MFRSSSFSFLLSFLQMFLPLHTSFSLSKNSNSCGCEQNHFHLQFLLPSFSSSSLPPSLLLLLLLLLLFLFPLQVSRYRSQFVSPSSSGFFAAFLSSRPSIRNLLQKEFISSRRPLFFLCHRTLALCKDISWHSLPPPLPPSLLLSLPTLGIIIHL